MLCICFQMGSLHDNPISSLFQLLNKVTSQFSSKKILCHHLKLLCCQIHHSIHQKQPVHSKLLPKWPCKSINTPQKNCLYFLLVKRKVEGKGDYLKITQQDALQKSRCEVCLSTCEYCFVGHEWMYWTWMNLQRSQAS